MQLARRGERNGGSETGLLVIPFSARWLFLLLGRLANPARVLGRNERELAVVGDDVGEKGGDADFVLALSSSLGQMLV